MQSYNCLLGKSNIPRALKLSRLNRRMRHDVLLSRILSFSLSSSFFLSIFSFNILPYRDPGLGEKGRYQDDLRELLAWLSCRSFSSGPLLRAFVEFSYALYNTIVVQFCRLPKKVNCGGNIFVIAVS